MSSVVISGDTSGTVTLQAPAVAGSTVLTLPSTSGTVVATSTGSVSGTLNNIQYFTTVGTATYTPTSGTTFVVVEVLSGGGSGGIHSASSSPGGSGAYARKRITSAFSGVTVTVGAGGAAKAGSGTTPLTGNAGGTSSFGSIVTCTGGCAGSGTGSVGTASTATGGDLNIPGLATIGGVPAPGSIYGTAGISYAAPSSSSQSATGYGAGGGANTDTSNSYNTSGAGSNGIVIVWEYI